jgi:hypothetical protein
MHVSMPSQVAQYFDKIDSSDNIAIVVINYINIFLPVSDNRLVKVALSVPRYVS